MIDLTDGEIDAICAGLRQNAAKVRFLTRMGLIVHQKPNGKPLVNRAHYHAVMEGSHGTPKRAQTTPAWRVAA
ncbi:MAG: DUF4224 domain-containing protein [Bryocella sp.]